MIHKEDLRKIAIMQRDGLKTKPKGILREKLEIININIPFAIVISGIRRCGKSTLLRQIMDQNKNFYYFNFEDPKTVSFNLKDFEKLNEVFTEEFGESNYYFFDEIQNVERWELYVRFLLDNNKFVVITGSNASLLSRELGTRLTGRHLSYELFPFSYKEFITFKKLKEGIDSFGEYFNEGGFPEYLNIGQTEVLQELLRDVLSRDVILRHNLKNLKTLNELTIYLLTNSGKEFSYNKLKKLFNLGSTNTIISFISYLEDSYLLFSLPKFDYSLKKQIVNPKKIYSIDNGLSKINSASFSEDKGKMLENMVFINLRKKYKEMFYFQEKNECDFIIKDRGKIIQAVQVCYNFNNENQDREINGLVEALKKFKLEEGLILTYNQEDDIEVEGKKIMIKPVWKWLLTI